MSNTIVQDLNTIKTARDNMKLALEGKGQTVSKDIRTYAQAISNIPQGGGSGDVKLFDTVEHMQQDPSPSEGDLAVVYREEILSINEDSEFDSCIFPNEVVLDEAFTDSIYGSFRSTGSDYFDGMVDMSSSSFRFDGWGDSSRVRVQYTSSDGITYTRTDGGEELQEFGTTIKWDSGYEEFNSVIGNFMKTGGNYFDGLYEYRVDNVDKEHFSFIPLSDISVKYENNTFTAELNTNYNQVGMYSISELNELYTKMYDELSPTLRGLYIWMSNNSIHGTFLNNPPRLLYALNNNTLNVYGMSVTAKSDSLKDYILDLDNGTYTLNSEISWEYDISDPSPYTSVHTYELPIDTVIICVSSNLPNLISPETTFASFNLQSPPDSMKSSIIQEPIINYMYEDYILASTQLDATSDYVYEKTFYGKNGIGEGTLQNSIVSTKNEVLIKTKLYSDISTLDVGALSPNLSNLYIDETNIICIPNLINTENVTSVKGIFQGCNNLKIIPNFNTSNVIYMRSMFEHCTNLTNIPNFDTSNVADMYYMFAFCNSLTTVPNFDTSNVTNIAGMFQGCYNLTSVPNFDVSNATNLWGMFMCCENLTTVPNFDVSNATALHSMFTDCTNLTAIPNLNLNYSLNIMASDMYNGCRSLTNVADLDYSCMNIVTYLFRYCSNIKNVINLNLGKTAYGTHIFYACHNLTDVDTINLRNLNNAASLFEECENLVNISNVFINNTTRVDMMFTKCNNLSNVSVQNIINMFLNANINSTYKNLMTNNSYSPFYNTNITSSRYSNRLTELTTAGWTY